MARYGKKASSKVKRAMHERKQGTLRSGRSGRKVKSKKQAIAIGLSEARRSGAKVPRKKNLRVGIVCRNHDHSAADPLEPDADPRVADGEPGNRDRFDADRQ